MSELFVDKTSEEVYNNLEPKEFFKFFREISNIPRESENERAVAEYVVEFAKARNFTYSIDQLNNVFVVVPATKGYKKQPPILLQSHLDMVCVKENDKQFDFAKDSIKFKIENGLLSADKTTLGADAGTGVATMLAIADNKKISHPKLELLFTTVEENGQVGIRNFNLKKIKSRQMINFDCGDSHTISVSSAGSIKNLIKKEYQTQNASADEQAISLVLSGGLGGHAGLAINTGKACFGNILGYLFCHLTEQKIKFRICDIITKKAIINYAKSTILVAKKDLQKAKKCLYDFFDEIKKTYQSTDPNISLTLTAEEEKVCAIGQKDSIKIAKLIAGLYTGAIRVDYSHDNAPLLSSSIQRITLNDGKLMVSFLIRSQFDVDKAITQNKYCSFVKGLGFSMKKINEYSGWPEREDSKLTEKFNYAHNQLFGSEIGLERVHGGLEVGEVIHKIPDMQAVAVSPTSRRSHTTDEYLELSAVKPFYDLILSVLSIKE